MAEAQKNEEKMTRLRAYVSENRLKSTRQREIIAEVFFGVEDHLSAEQLLILVREKVPTVSLATVYRTLNFLLRRTLPMRETLVTGKRNLSQRQSQEHHDHLICVKCGAIVEFVDDRIEELQHLVAQEHGYTIIDHKMELYGECPGCK